MKLYAVKARLLCSPSRSTKRSDELMYFLNGHFMRLKATHRILIVYRCIWRRIIIRNRRSLAARMIHLAKNLRSLSMYRFTKTPRTLNLFVIVKTRDSAIAFAIRLYTIVFCDNKAPTTTSFLFHVSNVALSYCAIWIAVVGNHSGHYETVRNLTVANFEWLKQVIKHRYPFL